MTEPTFALQPDEYGNFEKVDTSKYSCKIICNEPTCLQIRYVLPQDRTQVKFCKKHTRLYRLAVRAERAKRYRARNKLNKKVSLSK
jgi:hypothetical protein